MRIQSLFIFASLILVLAACAAPGATQTPTKTPASAPIATTQATATPQPPVELFSPYPINTPKAKLETKTSTNIISTPTPGIEATATPVPSETLIPDPTETPTPEASATPSYTAPPTETQTSEASATNTVKPTKTVKPTNTQRPTNTLAPTRTPRPTPTETQKPTPFVYPDQVINKDNPDSAQFFSDVRLHELEGKYIIHDVYYLGDNPNTIRVEPQNYGFIATDDSYFSKLSPEDAKICKEKALWPFKDGWNDETFWKFTPFSARRYRIDADPSVTPWKLNSCEWKHMGIDEKLKGYIAKWNPASVPNIKP